MKTKADSLLSSGFGPSGRGGEVLKFFNNAYMDISKIVCEAESLNISRGMCLAKKKYGQDATNVGDEGGFAPNIQVLIPMTRIKGVIPSKNSNSSKPRYIQIVTQIVRHRRIKKVL